MIRVACLGAGYFSRFHYDSWRRMERAVPVAACDLDRAKAEATGLPAFDSLDAMLGTARPDLLDVIVPPAAHAAAIRTALAAGIRAIICQKPFGADTAEAAALAAEAEAAGATLVIHENFRFQPWYRAIRAALDAGVVGDLHQITFRLRPGDGQGPRAYLDRQPYFQRMPRFLVRETGVHWIDTFRYLAGPHRAVYADLRRLNPAIAGEDAGHILFEHASGLRSLFDGNRHLDHSADNQRRTMGEGLVEGTAGTLRLSGDGAVHLRPFASLTERTLLAPSAHQGFGGDCVHALQTHVVEGLLDGAVLENTARDYLAVRSVEDAVYQSSDQRVRVEIG